MYRLILDYDITITRMNNLHFKKKKKNNARYKNCVFCTKI